MDERRHRAAADLVLVILCAAVYLPGLGSSPLWDPDEPRYAAATRQMADTGQWLVPQFNGRPRFEKPALFNWLQLPWVFLFGDTELAYRLPSALSACITALLVARIGWFSGSWILGLAAGSFFVTTFRAATYARYGLVDATLVMFVTLVLYAYGGAVTGALDRNRAFILGAAAAGFAFFTKGPVGLLVPMAGIALHRVWMGRLRPAPGLPYGRGVIVFSAIAFPWFILMLYRFGSAYLEFSLLKENVARMAGGPGYVAPTPRPFWYYLKVLPGDMAPWTLLCLAGIVFLAVRWRAVDPPLRALVRLAGAWAIAVMVFFSLSGYKLPHYILPVYPALALVTAVFLAAEARRGAGGARPSRWWLVGWLPTAALLAAAGVLCIAVVRALGEARPWWPVYLAPSLLIAGGCLGLVLCRHPVSAAGAAALSTALAFGALGGINVPVQLDPARPQKALCEAFKAHHPGDARVVGFDYPSASLVYYTGRDVVFTGDPAELKSLLDGNREVFVFTRRTTFDRLPPGIRRSLAVVAEKPVFNISSTRLFRSRERASEESIMLLKQ